MPQLNKGGKFVFGLSVIHPDLTIHIPPQTLLEYNATRDGKVIIFTGSKITGGFCVTTYSLLSIKLPHSTLAVLDLQSGMELLSIRSSNIAFTMGAKGPLLQKAHNFQGSIEKY